MSTNKTENYQLHAWEPQDDFLLQEINENFAAIDSLTQLVVGAYIGDYLGERDFQLGFTPAAVIVKNRNNRSNYADEAQNVCAIAIAGTEGNSLNIVEGGFHTALHPLVNAQGQTYVYLAFR